MLILLPYPVEIIEFIFILVALTIDPPVTTTKVVKIHSIGVALKNSLGTLQHVNTAIGSRQVCIVTQIDGAAVRRLDQRNIYIAKGILLVASRITLREIGCGVLLQTTRWARHRHQVLETITAVNVHAVSDRTQAMRWVEVTVTQDRMLASPESFITVFEFDASKVV